MSFEQIKRRTLQISVWNYETLQENDFMGGVCIDLSTVDLVASDKASWYRLSSSML